LNGITQYDLFSSFPKTGAISTPSRKAVTPLREEPLHLYKGRSRIPLNAVKGQTAGTSFDITIFRKALMRWFFFS